MRLLARDYATDVVLASWPAAERAAQAAADVASALLVAACPGGGGGGGKGQEGQQKEGGAELPHRNRNRTSTGATNPTHSVRPAAARAGARPGVVLHVAPDGNDSAPGAGTAASPLATVAGAQQAIRTRYPDLASRPAITVYLRSGDYYLPPRTGPLSAPTRSSAPSFGRFTAADSGSSAAAPITSVDAFPLKCALSHQGFLGSRAGFAPPPRAWGVAVMCGCRRKNALNFDHCEVFLRGALFRYASEPVEHADERDAAGGGSSGGGTSGASSGGPRRATLHGGVLLAGLVWSSPARSLGFPAGTVQATLPPNIHVDPQDQLYLAGGDSGTGTPLVRARAWRSFDSFRSSFSRVSTDFPLIFAKTLPDCAIAVWDRGARLRSDIVPLGVRRGNERNLTSLKRLCRKHGRDP
jgi:hypothetical protein